jgi:hypothetical protein
MVGMVWGGAMARQDSPRSGLSRGIIGCTALEESRGVIMNNLIRAGLVIVSLWSLSIAQVQDQTAQKKVLIREILTLIHASENADKNAAAMLDQMASQLPTIMRASLAQQAVEGTQKALDDETVNRMIDEGVPRMLNRMKVLMHQKIDYSRLIDEIFCELYDKYFKENELRDLIAFYKSATGQKFVQVQPALTSEAFGLSINKMQPAIVEIMNLVTTEELERWKLSRPKS